MFPGISIVIVNLDLKKDTAECIDSFLNAGALLKQLIVVDNGSSDGSVAFLREKYGAELGLIEAFQNLGYANGANMGIQQALKDNAQWVLVMNNDTIVAGDFLTELEKAASQNPNYAIFGPLILYYSQPERIWYLGNRLIPGTLITLISYRGQKERKDFPPLIPVDFVHGCGMLVRRDVFEKIGLFDTSYFMYADETDFCRRAHLAGIHLAAVPHARMWHKVSSYMKRRPPIMRYYVIRSQIWYYRRYARFFQVPIMLLFTVSRVFRLGLKDISLGHFDMLPAMVRAWADGWFGPMKKPDFHMKTA